MNSFQKIYIILEGTGNHLPGPPLRCPRPVKGSIPVTPPDTSNDHKLAHLHSINLIAHTIHISRTHMFTFK